jgi:arylsulfatase
MTESRIRQRPSLTCSSCLPSLTVALMLVLWGCSDRIEAPADAPKAMPAKRQAILILLDAARGDRFGYAGYPRETTPAMDELANHGLAFLSHYSQQTHTRGSLPQMLYSRYFSKSLFPTSSSVPYDDPRSLMKKIDDETISIPRALEQAGFATKAISAHSWIKPWTEFGRQFQELDDLSSILKTYSPPAVEGVDRALRWIREHRDEDYFLYLHLMDTHFPHEFTPQAQKFYGSIHAPVGGISGKEGQAPAQALEGDQRRYLDSLYDGSLRYVDDQIGRLVDFLKGEALFDDTLIVITSDHGEELLEVDGHLYHGGVWTDRVGHIPLLVSYPSMVDAARLNGFSELVDVSPTILGLLGVDIGENLSMDGVDLAAVARGELPERSSTVSRFGVRTHDRKLSFPYGGEPLLRNPNRSVDGLEVRLYDLENDPLEQVDIRTESPAEVDALVEVFRETLQSGFDRFQNSRNHEPPPTPFAIGSQHFQKNLAAVISRPNADSDTILAHSTSANWVESKDWQRHWLMGREEAPPITVQFPVPDGEYEISAHVLGRGTISISGGKTMAVDARLHAGGPGMNTDSTLLGDATVSGEMFSATLRPADDGTWLWIKMFGFRPLSNNRLQTPEEEAAHLEQLRALGYIE